MNDEIKNETFDLDELQSTLDTIVRQLESAEKVRKDKYDKLCEKRMECEREEAELKELDKSISDSTDNAKLYHKFIVTIRKERAAATLKAEAEFNERDELFALQLEETRAELNQLATEDGGVHAPRAKRIASVLDIELELIAGFKDDTGDPEAPAA